MLGLFKHLPDMAPPTSSARIQTVYAVKQVKVQIMPYSVTAVIASATLTITDACERVTTACDAPSLSE